MHRGRVAPGARKQAAGADGAGRQALAGDRVGDLDLALLHQHETVLLRAGFEDDVAGFQVMSTAPLAPETRARNARSTPETSLK